MRRLVFVLLLALASSALADEEWGIEYLPVDELTVTSEDKKVTLRIKVQWFEEGGLRLEQREHGRFVAEQKLYAGNERLPLDVLGLRTCIVRAFDMSIEGSPVVVPDRLWKDVGGFGLHKLPDLPENATDEQKEAYDFEMEEPGLRPQIRYSEKDDNYMIIWERPADCDQRHTIRWIISKDGKMIMRHLDIPPHHC